jgi:glutamyl-tRNA reductase
MKFVAVGLSYKTAPIEVREQSFIPESKIGECLQRLIDRDLIESGVLLSTCNRTELYAASAGEQTQGRLLESFGSWPHHLPFETWRRYAYSLEGDDAIGHLFRVAGGLDSMVLGEAQILGQLKDALVKARQAGALDARLEVIFQGALRTGKRVRTETELSRRPVSVAHAAVAKSLEVFGELQERGVLVIGAGPMSQVALRLLKNRQIRRVYLTSRTRERADRVAQPLGGQSVEFDRIGDIMPEVDILISSSSAPHKLFDRTRVEELQARRRYRPLLFIDLAVPRDVDPEVSQVTGVQLFNIDDLQLVATTSLEERKASVPPAERIIEEELARTRRGLDARESASTISALVRRVERLRDRELVHHLGSVQANDKAAREAMRALAGSLTAKFLHGPIRTLRESADPTVEAYVFAEAFDLEAEDDQDG